MIAKTINHGYRNLFSDIMIFAIGTVLAKAIQFILMPLYTTYMSTEAYGIAELTNNLSELFFPISTLCIYEAAFRFAVDPFFDNKKLATAVVKVIGSSMLFSIPFFLCLRFILHYEYTYYLYFILYAYSIRMCAAYYVRGKGMSQAFAISGIVNALALGLFNVLFLVIMRSNESGYLLSIGLSYCVSAVYLILVGKISQDYVRRENSKETLKILLKYCVPLIFYNVLYWFTTISGRYILLWFTDASSAGKYVAAIKIAAIVNMIQQAVYAAFQLNSSRIFTQEGKEKYYTEIINLFIGLYCVFGSVIIGFTPLIAKITLRNDFYSAKIYLPIIMLSAILNCISSLLGTMYSTYKNTRRMINVSLIGAAVNILVGIALTPLAGIWGVCIASVCCYFCQVIYKFNDVKTFCEIKYNWKIIIPNIVVIILQVIVTSVVEKYNLTWNIGIVIAIISLNLKMILKFLKNIW